MSLLDRVRKRHKEKQAPEHAVGHLSIVVNGSEIIRLDQLGRFTLADEITPVQVLDTLVGFYAVAEMAAIEAGYELPILDVITRAKQATMVKVLHS